jgi:hypothetical protein
MIRRIYVDMKVLDDMVDAADNREAAFKPVGYAYDQHDHAFTLFLATDSETKEQITDKKGNIGLNMRPQSQRSRRSSIRRLYLNLSSALAEKARADQGSKTTKSVGYVFDEFNHAYNIFLATAKEDLTPVTDKKGKMAFNVRAQVQKAPVRDAKAPR